MDLWMPRTDCLSGSEISYNTSETMIDPKRRNPWFIDSHVAEQGPFPTNKRRAIGTLAYTNPIEMSGPHSCSSSLWGNPTDHRPESPSSRTVDPPSSSFFHHHHHHLYSNSKNETMAFLYGSSVCGDGDGFPIAESFIGEDVRNACKEDESIFSVTENKNGDESNVISFGGFHDDVPEFPGKNNVSRFDELFVFDQEKHRHPKFGTMPVATAVHEWSPPKKQTKKVSPQNNFPSNVRSLLSTGMLDGVPVKYIAWSREKELHAVIKGSGYLCGCESCRFLKVINAYEFERHASCKTKHPNNHIYFENGKTIYGIVQELRSTSQDVLFDVIQTITGSPLNQKSFCLWKESFVVATRELERIYGMSDGSKP